MAVAKPSRFGSSRKQFKDRLPYICWYTISAANIILDRQTNSYGRKKGIVNQHLIDLQSSTKCSNCLNVRVVL